MLYPNSSGFSLIFLFEIRIYDFYFQEDKIMEKEKTIKEEIQEFYLNGGTYNEVEIDFGTPKGSEAL